AVRALQGEKLGRPVAHPELLVGNARAFRVDEEEGVVRAGEVVPEADEVLVLLERRILVALPEELVAHSEPPLRVRLPRVPEGAAGQGLDLVALPDRRPTARERQARQ